VKSVVAAGFYKWIIFDRFGLVEQMISKTFRPCVLSITNSNIGKNPGNAVMDINIRKFDGKLTQRKRVHD